MRTNFSFFANVNNIRRFFAALLLLVFIGYFQSAAAQSVHSDLKDPALVKRFKKISQSVLCVCGCNLVLDTCNMMKCEAWAMRGVIDGLLLDGKSDEFIIEGFIHGFGDIVDTHPAFKLVQPGGFYAASIQGFRTGFGEKHRALSRQYHTEIVMALVAMIILGGALLFIRSRFKKLETAKGAPKDSSTGSSAKKENDELYSKLYDD